MRGINGLGALLGALLGAATPARADVVHLQNGRTIQGQVLERRHDVLVVRSACGRIVVPLAQVARIERESRGSLLLAEARRAERDGDPQAAVGFYQRALDQGEREAVAGLSRLDAPLTARSAEGDPGARLEAAARALARGDPDSARRWAVAARDDPTSGADLRERARYVVGRALEELGATTEAAAAYRAALGRISVGPTPGPVPPHEGLRVPDELTTLRELARLRYTGIRLAAGSPGSGQGWSVLESPRALVVARPEHVRELAQRAEAALDQAAARLELPPLRAGRRVTLFVHDDLASYRETSGTGWAAGHASRGQATGEVARVVHLARGVALRSGLPHEMAHVLTGEALAGHEVPAWAREGAACHAEPEPRRARRWALGFSALAGRPARALLEVAREPFPGIDADVAQVHRYYARAALLFAALERTLGPRRALEVALDGAQDRDGLTGALARAGTSADQLVATARALADEAER